MAKPVAYFGYSKSGLTVQFINSSLNNPESYQWDFGDGNTSNHKNPSHTYSEMGFFTVKLICSNTDGDSEPLVLSIGIGDIQDAMNSSIFELVDHYLPPIISGTITSKEKINLVQKWQSYLQPLVVIPFEVLKEDTFNEIKWPGLVNSLISQLVSLDILLEQSSKFLIYASSISDISTIDDTSNNVTQSNNQIKSIETGPVKTEWYEGKTSTSESENLKNIGDAFANATKPGGLIDLLKESTCQLSSRLLIYLPMCGKLKTNTIVPSIVKRQKRYL